MTITTAASPDQTEESVELPSTFCEAFQRTARAFPGDCALRSADGEVDLTWSQVSDRVRETAAALAGLGVGPGDTVAMMLTNRPEFHIVDIAALHLGATPFSIYNTLPADQIAHVLRNAGARTVVTESGFLDLVDEACGEAPDVAQVVSVDAGGTVTLADLQKAPARAFDFDAAWRTVEPNDIAVLIYTSGTTGPPKGVQLTHRSLLAAWSAARGAVPALGHRGCLVSYLPHAHLADRFFAHYPALLTGSPVTCIADPRAIVSALPEVRPSVWLAVPRIWEKLKAALEAQSPGLPDADPAVKAAVRERLGLDTAEVLISGAAPIGADVLEYFAALGLEILEGYGMSECSAVISINRPGEARLGTVGRPCPGVDLRLEDDGEISVRGEMLMVGYRGQPEQTAEAIGPDGWLHTGDVGVLDEDGYLRIVDRKKELIINAAGKNMSPANIENTIKASSPLIGQAVAIGDRRPYNTALLVLDPDAATAHARQHGHDDASPASLAADPGVQEHIAQAIEQANAKLSRVEQVKRWTLLGEEWLPGGEELTPTSKLKRKPIAERYAAEIDAMYA